MSYDDWLATDTAGDRDDGIERMRGRLEDDEREQRWATFVAWLHSGRVSTLLRHIADLMDGRHDPSHIPLVVQQPILTFQETEGWHGVLGAIARVQAEQDPR